LRRQGERIDGCPDPEILATYWDRSLTTDERSHWETHFASCSDCQAQLAALARTSSLKEEEITQTTGTATTLSAWLNFRWLVPAASLAAVVLAVWVIRPDTIPVQQYEVPSDTAAPANRPVEQTAATEAARRSAADTPGGVREAGEAPPVALEEELVPENRERQELQLAEITRDRAAGAGRLSDEVEVEDEVDRFDDDLHVVDTLESGERQARIAPEPTGRLDAARPAGTPAAEALPQRASEVESFVARETASVADARLGNADVTATFVVTPPNTSVRWRVTLEGAIEHSADAGLTWTTQRPPDDTRWLAGAALSPTTGWIVGAGGAVVVTNDGALWRRTAAPTREDLVVVDAASSQSATVTSVRGRRYQTTDGGNTWEER
jgi:hypothetical protein